MTTRHSIRAGMVGLGIRAVKRTVRGTFERGAATGFLGTAVAGAPRGSVFLVADVRGCYASIGPDTIAMLRAAFAAAPREPAQAPALASPAAPGAPLCG